MVKGKPKRKSKYNAKATIHPEWGKFDSKGELERYAFLRLVQQAGQIVSPIQRQVSYRLVVNDKLVCQYRADFVYTRADGIEVTEDFKGFETAEFKLKEKLFFAVFGFKISVVKNIKEWQY